MPKPRFGRQERKDIYKRVKEYLPNNLRNIFTCPLLYRMTEKKIPLHEWNVERDFPEFFKQKPSVIKNLYIGWWKHDDLDSRIKALEKAIELIKKK
jgi:hypothetical protein